MIDIDYLEMAPCWTTKAAGLYTVSNKVVTDHYQQSSITDKEMSTHHKLKYNTELIIRTLKQWPSSLSTLNPDHKKM